MFSILEFRVQIANAFLSDILASLGNPAFLCVLGSRMLFNLKEAGERGQNEGTSYNATSKTAQESNINRTYSKNRASETGIEKHRDGITGERRGEERGRGGRGEEGI